MGLHIGIGDMVEASSRANVKISEHAQRINDGGHPSRLIEGARFAGAINCIGRAAT